MLLLLQALGAVADDCTWRSKASPQCQELCDRIDIRPAGCGLTDTSDSCQWCADFSALPAEECERRFFVDPWDTVELDVRPCFHIDGRCATRQGEEGRLSCGRKGPAPPPIAPPQGASGLFETGAAPWSVAKSGWPIFGSSHTHRSRGHRHNSTIGRVSVLRS